MGFIEVKLKSFYVPKKWDESGAGGRGDPFEKAMPKVYKIFKNWNGKKVYKKFILFLYDLYKIWTCIIFAMCMLIF